MDPGGGDVVLSSSYYSSSDILTNYYSAVTQLEKVYTVDGLCEVLEELFRLFSHCHSLVCDVDVLELKAILENMRATDPMIWEDRAVQVHGKLLRIISKAQALSSHTGDEILVTSNYDNMLSPHPLETAREDSKQRLVREVYDNGYRTLAWAIIAIGGFFCFYLVIPLSVSIALLVIASIAHEPKCKTPLENWGIVVGCFGVVASLLGFVNKMLSGVDKSGRRHRGPFSCFVWIVNFVIFVLVVVGCVFTYSINRSKMSRHHVEMECNYLLFWFSWYLLTISLSGTALVLILIFLFGKYKQTIKACFGLSSNEDTSTTNN